jgi:hypothetical protein
MSRFTTLWSAVVLLAVLLNGCGRFTPSPPPAVQIVVKYPGARPSVMEDSVCNPILQQLRGIEGDSTITCVSSCGRAEIYVQVKHSMSADLLLVLVQNRMALAAPVLPDKVEINITKIALGSPIPPPVNIHEIDFPVVNVDRSTVSRLGILVAAIDDAISDELGSGEPGPDSGKRLEKLSVKAVGGKDYRLRDFATIKTLREPSVRILREPPTEDGGK